MGYKSRMKQTFEITSQRRESEDVLSHTGPKCECPLDIDVSLTVTDYEDFLRCRHVGEPLDVVGDVLCSDLSIFDTSSRRGEPCDIISGAVRSATGSAYIATPKISGGSPFVG
jgi:hypothetical protein